MKKLILYSIAVIVIGLIVGVAVGTRNIPNDQQQQNDQQQTVVDDIPDDTSADIPKDIQAHIDEKSSVIRVETPQPLTTITPPLTITGEARGQWYFEGDFQITLVDWDGRIIAESHAKANGDWMTEEFAPFEGTIRFENPSNDADFSKRGTLILQKANPSGLPENADAVEIPVQFE